MVNQQVLQGNWNELRGKIRSKWGQLTNDDVQQFDGNVDRLMGLIQRKTGEGRESIERYLNELTAGGSSAVAQATEAVRDYAHQAGERIQEGTKQAAESMRQGYDSFREQYGEAEELVRRRPSEAAAVCFGAGVLTGLVLALLLHKNH
jgi:uncharacterized protein YjbJ (UPF0337 family)